LLPGWYDDWVLLERERLRQVRLHVCEAMCEKLARAGRLAEAIDAAHSAIRLAPLRESSHRALIGALAAEGNLGEAVRAYDQFSDRLADELGLSPSVHLESYVRALTHRRSVRRVPAG
jgi:DNA-binding SARP family transcriptional activator